MSAYVLLEDGTRFDGDAVGAHGSVTGEVVFTTGMSGYQESMTDPSFAGQLIAFTYPHIGNYGVSAEANVALCDLGAGWTVGEEGYESRSGNSWCAGRTLTGRILMTVAAGQVAFRLRSFALEVAS